MSDPDPAEITRHLHALGRGDPGAADALAPLVYRQLHNLAERTLNNESPGHTLQPGLNVSLADGLVGGDGESEERILDIIEIDRAMASLEALEPRAARVVELRATSPAWTRRKRRGHSTSRPLPSRATPRSCRAASACRST